MDKQKKKNKNKKKKNNQNNSNNDKVTMSDGVAHENGTSDRNDAEDSDPNKHDREPSGVQSSESAQAEQSWLQEKVALEETVNQLHHEIDSHKEKQAALETKIADLQNEKECLTKKELNLAQAEQSSLQEKASLEETIKLLKHKIDLHKEKQAEWEVKMADLQSEKESLLQKKADSVEAEKDTWLQDKTSLEIKIAELQSKKESWLRKEACLEERISKLSEDKAVLGLNQDRLEERLRQLERDNDSLVLKEKVSNEVISKLDGDITRLRLQVVELEEMKNSTLQENQKLVKINNLEKVSSKNASEEQTKHTSGRNDELNSQIEAACALVEKLITENSELVEKVNELYIKLEQRKIADGISLPVHSDSTPGVAEIANVMDRSSSTMGTTLSSSLDHLGAVQNGRVADNKMDIENGFLASNSNDESGEIVQIPLDENEIQSVESRDVDVNENSAVPFSDAPLIGAPFRFMSFVASYVSGADLVDNVNSGR